MSIFKKKTGWFKNKDKPQKRSSQDQAKKQKVFSYYTASRKQLDSFERSSSMIQNETIRKKHMGKIRQFWFVCFVALILLCVVGYLFTLGTVPHNNVSGVSYRDKKEYQKIVSNIFGHDIRNRFKPLLQIKSLQSEVGNAIPEAQSVVVKSSVLGHKPEVSIVLAEPMAVFTNNNSGNYIISTRGRILLPTSQTSMDTTSLPIIKNDSGVEAIMGKQFLSPDESWSLNKLIFQYKKNGLLGVIYTINKIPHEVTAKEPGRGYQVRYLLNETINQQYGAMIATQKKLQELNQTPVEYIDVRLAEKVYYK